MNIRPGNELRLPCRLGPSVAYRITAVRHYPVDFAELQPYDGGPKRTIKLSELNSPQVAEPAKQ